jgi:phosphoglycerate kinase
MRDTYTNLSFAFAPLKDTTSHIVHSETTSHQLELLTQETNNSENTILTSQNLRESIEKTKRFLISRKENNGEPIFIMIENIRKDDGEESCDPDFIQKFSEGVDYYITDAYGAMHREHASITGVPKNIGSQKCFGGFLLEHELLSITKTFTPTKLSTVIIGGVKFETKLPLIQKLSKKYTHVILGGGLLNTYLKISGYEIGKSVYDEQVSKNDFKSVTNIVIPESVCVERAGSILMVSLSHVHIDDVIVDIVVSDTIKDIIHNSQMIVWNGPMGWYEKSYTQGSQDIVTSFSETCYTVVGGGDTVTMFFRMNMVDTISWISTGGGAMLCHIYNETLPGINVLYE